MTKTIPLIITQPDTFVNEGIAKQITRVVAAAAANTFPVMEIFYTVEGEGTKIGTPRVLARVGGCPVGCAWCDSVYTWAAKGLPMVTPELFVEQIHKVARGRVREVSITGGEPMMYPEQMIESSRLLKALGYKTSIETSGVVISQQVFNEFDFVSLDVKTPSAKVPLTPELIQGILYTAKNHRGAQVKAVITDAADLAWIRLHLMELLVPTDPYIRPLVLTPCADNTKEDVHIEQIARVCNMIQDWNEGFNITTIVQQHKLYAMDPTFIHPGTGKELQTYHITNGAKAKGGES